MGSGEPDGELVVEGQVLPEVRAAINHGRDDGEIRDGNNLNAVDWAG